MASELEQKVDRILSYIETDQGTGRKGLYAMVEEMEGRISHVDERVKKLEQVEEKRGWIMAKVGAIGAGLGTFFTWIATKWDDIANLVRHL